MSVLSRGYSQIATLKARLFYLVFLVLAGCVHDYRAINSYPTISRVAVTPFINLSNNPAVDGRQVGAAYYAELQKIPGFEVVPIGVVEAALEQNGLTLSGAGEVQQLAQILGVDCVVVGAISDFTPYYPPRLALQIEWYAADPVVGFAPAIPTGKKSSPSEGNILLASAESSDGPNPPLPTLDQTPGEPQLLLEQQPESPQMLPLEPSSPPLPLPGGPPILTYTRLFDGADEKFTRALRDDVRFGGEQGYLQRSEDFIRFACHQAICEMLGQTPGAVETRLVFRRPNRR